MNEKMGMTLQDLLRNSRAHRNIEARAKMQMAFFRNILRILYAICCAKNGRISQGKLE